MSYLISLTPLHLYIISCNRIGKHESNCRHRDQPGTRLSAHVWKLKDKDHPYDITWQILSRASGYNPTKGMCSLCLKEKFLIMFSPATASLNLRSEIFSSCRHRKGKLLDKTWVCIFVLFFIPVRKICLCFELWPLLISLMILAPATIHETLCWNKELKATWSFSEAKYAADNVQTSETDCIILKSHVIIYDI